MCPYIRKLFYESCVDFLLSSFHYKKSLIQMMLEKSKNIRERCNHVTFIIHTNNSICRRVQTLFHKNWNKWLEIVCCKKIVYPQLKYKENNEQIIPKLHPIRCILGYCSDFRVNDEFILK